MCEAVHGVSALAAGVRYKYFCARYFEPGLREEASAGVIHF
jgi:hypothetical protein